MPTTTQYNQAIQNLRVTVGDKELQGGKLAVNRMGLPLQYSGNFAVVFQVRCPNSGKTWAVKCFTKDVDHRRERYDVISKHLRQAKLPFMVGFEYQEKGILVGERWYPIVKMDWVEGDPLNVFVAENIGNHVILKQLPQLWLKLARRLRSAEVAHADLQHGNVLLVPAGKANKGPKLRLVDYDGIHVPALADLPSGELGHRAFQHPQRLRDGIYSADVDRFSHLAIYCAFHCLIVGGRDLWQRYDNEENLLFREQDFAKPRDSKLFRELWQVKHPVLHVIVGRLLLATGRPLADVPLLDDLYRDGKLLGLSRKEERQAAIIVGAESEAAKVTSPKRSERKQPSKGTSTSVSTAKPKVSRGESVPLAHAVPQAGGTLHLLCPHCRGKQVVAASNRDASVFCILCGKLYKVATLTETEAAALLDKNSPATKTPATKTPATKTPATSTDRSLAAAEHEFTSSVASSAPAGRNTTPSDSLFFPAGFLFITGGLSLLFELLVVAFVGLVAIGAMPAPSGSSDEPVAPLLIGYLMFSIFSGIIVAGSVAMLQRKSYPIALAGAIVGVLPCAGVCFMFNIPFAVWALVLLLNRDVKASFR